MQEYNQAIDDIVKMLEGDIAHINARINKKNLSPYEETRMVEQVRTMGFLKVRIDWMRKGSNFGYLLSPEQHGEDIEHE